jgi:hypothetical protein
LKILAAPLKGSDVEKRGDTYIFFENFTEYELELFDDAKTCVQLALMQLQSCTAYPKGVG